MTPFWKTLKLFILRVICSPSDVLAYVIVGTVGILWGKIYYKSGVLVAELKPDSWPVRTWYKGWGGTTFGHAIMVGPKPTPDIFIHEFVHVEQIEVTALFSFLWAILVAWRGHVWTALISSAIGGLLYMLLGMVTAWLRGESFYMGSVEEQAAYAITDEKEEKEKSNNV